MDHPTTARPVPSRSPASRPEPASSELTARLRGGIWAALAQPALFIPYDLAMRPSKLRLLFLMKALSVFLGLGALVRIRRPRAELEVCLIALVAVTAMYVTVADRGFWSKIR